MVQFLLEHQGHYPLASIWLGGAYGRGEGAVYRQARDERPWFEYELFLVQRQTAPLTPAELAERSGQYIRCSEALSRQLSQSVRLRSAGNTQTIKNLEPRLLWHDLCLGYRVIWGDADLIPQLRNQDALTPQIAQNLLLYWGGRLLEMDSDPQPLETFYRAAAALGDAWLISSGLYHVSSQERGHRFHLWQREHSPDWGRELGYLYQEALQYQLLPSDFDQMYAQLPSRLPGFYQLFVRAYLDLFGQQVGYQLDLNHFESLFLEHQETSTGRQLRQLMQNLRQYKGKQFQSGWYSRPLLHRLYFLLPYLLADTLPSSQALQRVLPDISPTTDLPQLKQTFMIHWHQIAEELI